MPLRIAIVVTLTIAACASVSLVAPLSAHAMSSSDDADLGSSDSVPIAGPTGPAGNREGTVGDTSRPESHPGLSSARAQLPSLSGVGLAAAIVAGFLPAIVMMVRSHRRRRAGAHNGSSAGSLHAGDSASFGAA